MPLFALFRLCFQMAFPTRQVEAAPWSLLGLFRLSARPCLWHKYRWVRFLSQSSPRFCIPMTHLPVHSYLVTTWIFRLIPLTYHHVWIATVHGGRCCPSLLRCCSARGNLQGCYTTRRKKMDTEIDQQEETSFSNSETNGMDHSYIYVFLFHLLASLLAHLTGAFGPFKSLSKQIVHSLNFDKWPSDSTFLSVKCAQCLRWMCLFKSKHDVFMYRTRKHLHQTFFVLHTLLCAGLSCMKNEFQSTCAVFICLTAFWGAFSSWH